MSANTEDPDVAEINQLMESLPERAAPIEDPQAEAIRRLQALSVAARQAADVLQQHGLNGLSAVDNVNRLCADVNLLFANEVPVPRRQKPAKKKLPQLQLPRQVTPIRAVLQTGPATIQQYMQKRNKPVCRVCSNLVGIHYDKELKGVMRVLGLVFLRWGPGHLMQVVRQQKLQTMVIERIEGLTVYLGEPKPAAPRENNNARTDERTDG